MIANSPDAARPAPPGVRLVRAAIAPLHAEPRVSSTQTSQLLAWHPVSLLEEAPGDWWKVRGADGYEGWVHEGYLASPSAASDIDLGRWPGTARRSFGGTVRDLAGESRAVPLGAFLHPEDDVQQGRAAFADELARECPPQGESIMRFGIRHFRGTSYQWGGITPWGCDCSGFIQTVFGFHAVALPRDAWQQAEQGSEAGADIGAARAGDLIFFSDRVDARVTHVGLALGGMRMAHLALGRGGFAIERLDDGRDPYVAALVQRFRTVRRVLSDEPADGSMLVVS